MKRPIASISDNSPIEFFISSQNEEYLDLRDTYFWLKLQILKEDGTKYTEADNDKFSPVNYLLNSAFSQVDVTLSDTLISQSNNTHPWRSYFEVRFCTANTAKYHWLKASGYFKDEESAADSVSAKRHKMCTSSKIFTLMGRIHTDIFQQNKLLINGVPLKLKLIRASNEFCLQGNNVTPKLVFLDMVMFIKKVKLNPSILAAHAKVLSENNVKYYIVRALTKAISITANQNIHILDNVYIGNLPRKIIIGLLENDSHLGSYSKSPFNFKNHGLNFIQVFLNSEAVPNRPYVPDFATDKFAREYFSLFDNFGQSHGGFQPLDIEFSEFKNNNCLFAFDFSPDGSNGCGSGHLSIPKTGTMRIELHFATAPTNPLKLIVFAEFDSVIEINKNREVLIDF